MSKSQKAGKLWIMAGGTVLALLTVAGISCVIAEDITVVELFRSHANTIVVLLIMSLVFFIFALNRLFETIDDSTSTSYFDDKKDRLRIPGKTWLLFSGIILVTWLPYLIIMFPGTEAGTDYFWQLLQGCGALPLSRHHPVFGSLVFALLYKAGYALGGATGGIFFTCLFQMVLMSVALGYCLAALKALDVPKKVYRAALAFICLCPVFPTNVMWAVKDSIFSSISVLLFFGVFLFVWKSFNSIEVPTIGTLPVITGLALLFSIYRNGTLVIAIALLLVMIIVLVCSGKRRNALKCTVSLIILMLCISGWNTVQDALKVYPTNFRETCGILSSQILRCYQVRPEKISEEQEAKLEYFYRDKIETVGSLKDLANRNGYLIADGIKPAFFNDSKEVKEYLNLWLQIGLHNPEIYFDEALKSSAGYWWIGYDPEKVFHAIPLYLLRPYFETYDYETRTIRDYFEPIPMSLGEQASALDETMPEHLENYAYLRELIYVENRFESAAEAIQKATEKLKTIPVVSIVLAPGIYTWMTILALTYMFSRKKSGRYLWPIILLTAIACVSPVNGYMRYVLPVDLFSIIMIVICFVPDKAEQ